MPRVGRASTKNAVLNGFQNSGVFSQCWRNRAVLLQEIYSSLKELPVFFEIDEVPQIGIVCSRKDKHITKLAVGSRYMSVTGFKYSWP